MSKRNDKDPKLVKVVFYLDNGQTETLDPETFRQCYTPHLPEIPYPVVDEYREARAHQRAQRALEEDH